MKTDKWLEEQNDFENINPDEKRIYDLIFSELAKEEDIQIPQSFADRVSGKAFRRKMLYSRILLKFTYAFIIGVVVSFYYLFIAMDTTDTGKLILNNFSISSYVMLLGVVMLYFIIEVSDVIFVRKNELSE